MIEIIETIFRYLAGGILFILSSAMIIYAMWHLNLVFHDEKTLGDLIIALLGTISLFVLMWSMRLLGASYFLMIILFVVFLGIYCWIAGIVLNPIEGKFFTVRKIIMTIFYILYIIAFLISFWSLKITYPDIEAVVEKAFVEYLNELRKFGK